MYDFCEKIVKTQTPFDDFMRYLLQFILQAINSNVTLGIK